VIFVEEKNWNERQKEKVRASQVAEKPGKKKKGVDE
jgi:hypothetical protein